MQTQLQAFVEHHICSDLSNRNFLSMYWKDEKGCRDHQNELNLRFFPKYEQTRCL